MSIYVNMCMYVNLNVLVAAVSVCETETRMCMAQGLCMFTCQTRPTYSIMFQGSFYICVGLFSLYTGLISHWSGIRCVCVCACVCVRACVCMCMSV